jgi:hypothetical protein
MNGGYNHYTFYPIEEAKNKVNYTGLDLRNFSKFFRTLRQCVSSYMIFTK